MQAPPVNPSLGEQARMGFGGGGVLGRAARSGLVLHRPPAGRPLTQRATRGTAPPAAPRMHSDNFQLR
jgi:hypothetical protein